MGIVHLNASASADELKEVLVRDGAVIIDELAGIEQIDAIAAEMQPYIDATPNGGDDFTGRTTRRSGALVGRSPASHALIQHPEQRRILVEDPSRIEQGVEELLRWVSPIHNMARTTTRWLRPWVSG